MSDSRNVQRRKGQKGEGKLRVRVERERRVWWQRSQALFDRRGKCHHALNSHGDVVDRLYLNALLAALVLGVWASWGVVIGDRAVIAMRAR